MKSTLAASLAILLAASTAMGSPARAESRYAVDHVGVGHIVVGLARSRYILPAFLAAAGEAEVGHQSPRPGR
jgi:hypothetical protein